MSLLPSLGRVSVRAIKSALFCEQKVSNSTSLFWSWSVLVYRQLSLWSCCESELIGKGLLKFLDLALFLCRSVFWLLCLKWVFTLGQKKKMFCFRGHGQKN